MKANRDESRRFLRVVRRRDLRGWQLARRCRWIRLAAAEWAKNIAAFCRRATRFVGFDRLPSFGGSARILGARNLAVAGDCGRGGNDGQSGLGFDFGNRVGLGTKKIRGTEGVEVDDNYFLRRACGFVLIFIVFGCWLPLAAIAIQSLHDRHQQQRPSPQHNHVVPEHREHRHEAGAVVVTIGGSFAGDGARPRLP